MSGRGAGFGASLAVAAVAVAAGTILAAGAPRAPEATAGTPGSPYRWWGAPRRPGEVLEPLLSRARNVDVARAPAAALLADGRRAIAADEGGRLHVTAADGSVVRSFAGPRRCRILLRTGPGDRTLAAGLDGAAWLVDPEGGAPLRLEGAAGWILCGDAAPAAGRLVVGDASGNVGVHDTGGRRLLRLERPGARILAVALAPDGARVFAADSCGKGVIAAVDGTGAVEVALPGGEPRARFTEDGFAVVVTAGGETCRFPADGSPPLVLRGAGATRVALPLPGGRVLLAGVNGRLTLVGADGATLATAAGHRGAVAAAVAMPDGGVVTAGMDATLRRHGPALEPGGVGEVPPGAVRRMEVAPDGARLLLVFTEETRAMPLLVPPPAAPAVRRGSESTDPPVR